MKIALAMMNYIRRRNPHAIKIDEANKAAWANEFRLMREVDERDPREIVQMLDFAFNHEYWQPHIQSPSGFRRMWDGITADYRNRMENGYGG